MSSLWTPEGEHPLEEGGPSQTAPEAGAGSSEAPLSEEQQQELRRVREELLAVPVVDVIANHAIGLFQLALLHLSLDQPHDANEAVTVNPEAARLAIDAMAALVEGLGNKLGPHEEALRGALAQIQVAYVQMQESINSESEQS